MNKPIDWPHAPPHRLGEGGAYFVTASTYLKEHHFRSAMRLDVLQRGLLKALAESGWDLEAWSIFSNHYHFVARTPEGGDGASNLSGVLGKLHEKLAKWINRLEGVRGRKIWHNYRETQLSFENSYFARLHYVHNNPVRHGLVRVANQYPWCSAAWFERTCKPSLVKTIYGFKIDKVNVEDDFEPIVG